MIAPFLKALVPFQGLISQGCGRMQRMEDLSRTNPRDFLFADHEYFSPLETSVTFGQVALLAPLLELPRHCRILICPRRSAVVERHLTTIPKKSEEQCQHKVSHHSRLKYRLLSLKVIKQSHLRPRSRFLRQGTLMAQYCP